METKRKEKWRQNKKVSTRRQNKIKYINCTIRKRKVLEEIKIFVKFNEETKKLKWVNKKDGDKKKLGTTQFVQKRKIETKKKGRSLNNYGLYCTYVARGLKRQLINDIWQNMNYYSGKLDQKIKDTNRKKETII